MLAIKVDRFDEVSNLSDLASFTYFVKQQTHLLAKNQSQIDIQADLEQLQRKYKFALFRAYHNSRLLGYILLFVNTPKFGISWDWNPIVNPDESENYVAGELIKKCIEFSRSNDISKLEVCFTVETESENAIFLKQVEWYKRFNFSRGAKEVLMELSLDKFKIEPIKVPKNYEITPLNHVNPKLLPLVAYEAFNNSEDHAFLNLQEEEKQVMCEKYFDLSTPILQDASFILKQGEEIIGFSIIKVNENQAVLNSIGIIPRERNKGFAKTLLSICIEKLIEKEFKTIILDVIVENNSAYNLYKSLGFKVLNSTIIYTLDC
ncbi:MAG: GNAT family N-acetyltransferase [Candidatus Thorarchaeota archaeon]